jgi:hypothetical protein
MKALILTMSFICGQAMGQSTEVFYNNTRIVAVQTFNVTEYKDANAAIKYNFSPDLKLPIKTIGTISSIVLPDGKFTTIAFFDVKGNVEFFDMETTVNYKIRVDLNLIFGDGYTFGMRFNKNLNLYENIYYDDLGNYKP